MKYSFLKEKKKGYISPMIYGHFIEHFHRQIYGGVYDPGNELSDEDGMRSSALPRAVWNLIVLSIGASAMILPMAQKKTYMRWQ